MAGVQISKLPQHLLWTRSKLPEAGYSGGGRYREYDVSYHHYVKDTSSVCFRWPLDRVLIGRHVWAWLHISSICHCGYSGIYCKVLHGLVWLHCWRYLQQSMRKCIPYISWRDNHQSKEKVLQNMFFFTQLFPSYDLQERSLLLLPSHPEVRQAQLKQNRVARFPLASTAYSLS